MTTQLSSSSSSPRLRVFRAQRPPLPTHPWRVHAWGQDWPYPTHQAAIQIAERIVAASKRRGMSR